MIIKLQCNNQTFICDTMSDAFDYIATNKITNFRISKMKGINLSTLLRHSSEFNLRFS